MSIHFECSVAHTLLPCNQFNRIMPNQLELLFSLSNWFALLFLRSAVLFIYLCMCVCALKWHEKIKFEGKTLVEMVESLYGMQPIGKRILGVLCCGVCVCVCVSKSEKVVSSCFLHCNANTYKYMHILVCNEYIRRWLNRQQRNRNAGWGHIFM